MRFLPVVLACLCLVSPAVAQQAPPPQDPFASPPAAPQSAPQPPAIPPAPADLAQALELLDRGAVVSFSEVPLEAMLEFHKAEEGKTYASISIGYRIEEIRKAAGGDVAPQLFALLRGTGPESSRYDFTLPIDFADSGVGSPAGMKVFQTGSAVDPGPYRFSVGLWIPGRNLAGGRAEDVVVPNFTSSALDLSSVTLAAKVERAAPASTGLKLPFIWGSFKVVPRLAHTLPRQEPLRLYYQIYNAAADPASGKPRLDITYTFYQKKNGKFLQAAQQPIKNQDNQVAIYELPVDGWPAGEFKVQVQVLDAVSKATASRELLFQLR